MHELDERGIPRKVCRLDHIRCGWLNQLTNDLPWVQPTELSFGYGRQGNDGFLAALILNLASNYGQCPRWHLMK
ncbi:hypothetical protein [Acidovorax sp. LjRoot194]|uniref:hypothetical protein n=1 Tax=Acidovorax sp. LjRoot194 TaxID=3342280 RepID=UPI003ECEA382